VEPDIRDLLQERAGDVRIAPELPAPVLRRARRRRGVTATLAATTALVLVAGAVVGLRATVVGRTTPGDTTPPPTAAPSPSTSPSFEPGPAVMGFPGLWPGAGPERLREAYVGGSTWLVHPEQTATEFARLIVGWPGDRIRVHDVSTIGDASVVTLWDTGMSATFASNVALVVDLQRIGGMDPPLWDVVRVGSGLMRVTCPSPRQDTIQPEAPLEICGELSTPPAGWRISATVEYAGSELQGSEAQSTADIPVTGSQFRGPLSLIASYLGEDVSLAITVDSGSGHVLGMFAERLGVELPTPEPTPTASPASPAALTAAAAAKRAAILAAARSGDFSALGPLVDPSAFHFRVAGAPPGSSVAARAITYWKRRGPDALRILDDLLRMPSAREDPGGAAETFVWPAVATMAPAAIKGLVVTDRRWASSLGALYPHLANEVQRWIAAGHYTGWRVEITADGRWISYFEGG
jgi:hypothetical protein